MSFNVTFFTDTYHPTINGVTYTIDRWAKRWNRSFGSTQIVYPKHPEYTPSDHEFPVPSVGFPWYESYRIGAPLIPRGLHDPDIVHLHSLYTVGIGGGLLSKLTGTPLVATYHTPINEYSDYLISNDTVSKGFTTLLRLQERFALGLVDHVITPSEHTKDYLDDVIGTGTPVDVISNGVDTETFRPEGRNAFRDRYNLSGTIIGYTGRQGFEKQLEKIIYAAEEMQYDVTVVFGGDGPAREQLEAIASEADVSVEFLGFLPRNQLPEFYSALDVFAFPSPIETEGIVAMESMSCGTPVVGINSGALTETIHHGDTGYLYEPHAITEFADYLDLAVEQYPTLREECLNLRAEFDIDASLRKVTEIYEQLT